MQKTARATLPAVALTAAAILILAGLISPSASRANDDASRANDNDGYTTFTVDVAEVDTTNKQNDVDPAEGQDTFTRGDTFVLDGNIYPGGTLPTGVAG